ncbi:hypothetical protein LTR56_013757 [Elasticomyces elasticus]|nr:hypothetical protein LTR22_022820 [Elasticomyces elasticus]KAK3637222.1 hypothetical protein LTR56_013757 [Elasticomyces elasticus]KAK5755284.1 hypothetical protein LTS12_014626 [Elasticomyces elasticus]
MHYAPALLALAGLAAAYRIPPLTTTEWCLAKCNDVGGDSCVAACVGNPNLSAEQIHAAHECEFKCHIPSKGAEGDLACLRACHKRYYYATTSTKAATSATTSGSLARRSDLAASTTMFSITVTGIPAPPLATPTAISLTPTEFCLGLCEPVYDEDLDEYDASCVAGCIGNPDLSSAQVAAAQGCYSTRPRGGDESVEDWNAYVTCIRACDDRYYSTTTKAATSTATSGSLARRSGLAGTDATTSFSTITKIPAVSTNKPTNPKISPKETCHASCIPGDLDCEYICIDYPMPYPGGSIAAAYGDCDAACKRLTIMEQAADLYSDCLEECEGSYYDPSTNTKASAIAATNAGLGPRDPITAASPTRTPTSAMSSATHTASPKEICMASCGSSDIDCAIECINNESLFPGEDAAAQECEAACRKLIAMGKDPGEMPTCLMVCAFSYNYPVVSTNTGLNPRGTLTPAATKPQLAQRSLIPVTLVPVYSDSPDIEVSPKEVCLTECSPQDIACKARCVGVPNPSPTQIAATNKCEAACPQGNGTAAQTQFYAACLQKCVDSYYFSGTGTIAAGITATSTGWSAKITTMTSSTMIWPSVTLSENSKIMFWQPAMTSSSSAGSATGGSTASSSATGGPASSGSAPKLGQAGGLLGLMMAMLAL